MKKTISLIIVLILLVCAVFTVSDFLGTGGEDIKVYIPSGSGTSSIAEILGNKGVVRFPVLFKLYIRNHAAELKAGMHDMNLSMGYADALAELKRNVPDTDLINVLIPEGYELREIAQTLEKNGIVSQDEFYDAVQNYNFDYDFLSDADKSSVRLEGYLFPATYEFKRGTDAVTVIKTMLDAFDRIFTEDYEKRAKELDMTIHEVITLASIIEREAAKGSERATVSSVFHNRLNIGMSLQSCASVQYILKERKPVLSVADTKIDSPYNTYQNPGLPPGPIASPGEECIKAALYPDDTDYLFFVADGTGGHTFSKTFEEHQAAQGN